jgi:hypothetical protein
MEYEIRLSCQAWTSPVDQRSGTQIISHFLRGPLPTHLAGHTIKERKTEKVNYVMFNIRIQFPNRNEQRQNFVVVELFFSTYVRITRSYGLTFINPRMRGWETVLNGYIPKDFHDKIRPVDSASFLWFIMLWF